MRLIIENSYKEDLKPFINDIIIPVIAQYLYAILDSKYLKIIDDYLYKKYNKYVSSKQIISVALNNMQLHKFGDNYQISINPNVVIKQIDAKLYDLCALINYGNLEVPPYNIFDQV